MCFPVNFVKFLTHPYSCITFWKSISTKAISHHYCTSSIVIFPGKDLWKSFFLVQKLYKKSFIYLKRTLLEAFSQEFYEIYKIVPYQIVHLLNFQAPGKFLEENDQSDVLLWTISFYSLKFCLVVVVVVYLLLLIAFILSEKWLCSDPLTFYLKRTVIREL